MPTQELLLTQIEAMFVAFHSHLKMLDKNRICPCNACASAPNLELKIISHCSELQFIEIQGKKKPFGQEVIQAHRLLKNSVDSDNYVLLSKALSDLIGLDKAYQNNIFQFKSGVDQYDNQSVAYSYSIVNKSNLDLKSFSTPQKVRFDQQPHFTFSRKISTSAQQLLEYITNYKYRHYWVEGVDKFEYNENEVTRINTEPCLCYWRKASRLCYRNQRRKTGSTRLWRNDFQSTASRSCISVLHCYPNQRKTLVNSMLKHTWKGSQF